MNAFYKGFSYNIEELPFLCKFCDLPHSHLCHPRGVTTLKTKTYNIRKQLPQRWENTLARDNAVLKLYNEVP